MTPTTIPDGLLATLTLGSADTPGIDWKSLALNLAERLYDRAEETSPEPESPLDDHRVRLSALAERLRARTEETSTEPDTSPDRGEALRKRYKAFEGRDGQLARVRISEDGFVHLELPDGELAKAYTEADLHLARVHVTQAGFVNLELPDGVLLRLLGDRPLDDHRVLLSAVPESPGHAYWDRMRQQLAKAMGMDARDLGLPTLVEQACERLAASRGMFCSSDLNVNVELAAARGYRAYWTAVPEPALPTFPVLGEEGRERWIRVVRAVLYLELPSSPANATAKEG